VRVSVPLQHETPAVTTPHGQRWDLVDVPARQRLSVRSMDDVWMTCLVHPQWAKVGHTRPPLAARGRAASPRTCLAPPWSCARWPWVGLDGPSPTPSDVAADASHHGVPPHTGHAHLHDSVHAATSAATVGHCRSSGKAGRHLTRPTAASLQYERVSHARLRQRG